MWRLHLLVLVASARVLYALVLYKSNAEMRRKPPIEDLSKYYNADFMDELFATGNTAEKPDIVFLDSQENFESKSAGKPNYLPLNFRLTDSAIATTTENPKIRRAIQQVFADLMDLRTEPATRHSTISPITSSTVYNKTSLKKGECFLEGKRVGVCLAYHKCNYEKGDLVKGSYNDCSEIMHVCCYEQPSMKMTDMNRKISCGVVNHNGVTFRNRRSILTMYGEFPWMLGILSTKNENSSTPWNRETYRGGATLIGPRAAITTADIVPKSLRDEPLKVRAGDWDTNSNDESVPYIDSVVVKVLQHGKYKPDYYRNNVALLILETPIERTETVGYACLPPLGEIPPNDESCYSVRWGGVVDESGSSGSSSFKKISTKIINSRTCELALWTMKYSNKFEVDKTLMCADSEESRDTCRRTSGSPLVCPIPNMESRYTQYGIGLECWSNHPALYTNLASMRDWIDEQIKAADLDTSTYSY